MIRLLTKDIIPFIIVIILFSCKTTVPAAVDNTKASFAQLVNPFIGTTPLTDSAIVGFKVPDGWRPWSGLVYPGSALPNAMVQLSPITEFGSGAGYEYEDSVIYGFAHTNKGHWNLCNIPILPISGSNDSEKQFSSRFSHQSEAAHAGYYQVFLQDYKINVKLTSTLRCGYHQYAFDNSKDREILFDLAKSNNRVVGWKINQENASALSGYQDIGEEKIYFYATLNNVIERIDVKNENTKEGRAVVHLKDSNDQPVELKIGLSFVSIENAKQNLAKEIGNQSFVQIQQQAEKKWNDLLSKIEVKGGTAKQKQLFYTSLYRAFLWPALRSDVNGEYTDVKKKVIKADFNYYTVPSLWDTYRNKLILLGLLSPKVTADVIQSLKDRGDKTGFIPTFFHGDHAAPFIAGSYLRGINGFNVQEAYKLLLRNAFIEGSSRPFLNEYMQKGFISDPDVAAPHVETKGRAGVSKTLEYAYDDYALAQLANNLGDTTNYRLLMQRSQNYRNMFDPATRFMRGRLENGEWVKNFNPQYPYYEYMYREANAWQVSFFAPHDMNGLVSLYGGAKSFEEKLDSLFTLPWNPNYIARNVETMIGQYCHGNQPDHEAPFSYYFINKPEKSQKVIDYILNNLYGMGKEGLDLSGMDDAGEMSSWYVFNALGLYPFSSADTEYIVTVPLFDSVNWKLNDGKTLLIKKNGKSRNMQSILVNGTVNKGYFVSHGLFQQGGEINIKTW